MISSNVFFLLYSSFKRFVASIRALQPYRSSAFSILFSFFNSFYLFFTRSIQRCRCLFTDRFLFGFLVVPVKSIYLGHAVYDQLTLIFRPQIILKIGSIQFSYIYVFFLFVYTSTQVLHIPLYFSKDFLFIIFPVILYLQFFFKSINIFAYLYFFCNFFYT